MSFELYDTSNNLSRADSTFYHNHEWLKLLLWFLNGFTTVITICNLLYLKTTFPKVKDIPSKKLLEDSMSSIGHKIINKNMNDIIDITDSMSLSQTDSMRTHPARTDSFIRRESKYRAGIQKYFYVVSVIPCCVSYAGHYGARYPSDASWIFPGMNIAIGIGFLCFIRMMVMSCEGWTEIKRALITKPDECESCRSRPLYKKCCRTCCCKPFFLKENAYEGLKQRILFCCLILVKPIINYIGAMFEIDYHSDTTNQRIVAYAMQTLTMFTTFIPLNVMRSFHDALLPYTRVRRSGIKRALVGVLAPVCQIQEFCIHFVWMHWDIKGFEGINDTYKWCCVYGVVLVVEMTFISMIITFVAYRPNDLRLWEYPESFLRKHGYKGSMKDEEFLFGKNGIIDNVEEEVPSKEAYRYSGNLGHNQGLNQGGKFILNASQSQSHSHNGQITDLRTLNNPFILSEDKSIQ